MDKAAITHINASVTGTIATSRRKNNKIARLQIVFVYRGSIDFIHSCHCARQIDISSFCIDVLNKAAAIKTTIRRTATIPVRNANMSESGKQYIVGREKFVQRRLCIYQWLLRQCCLCAATHQDHSSDPKQPGSDIVQYLAHFLFVSPTRF